MKLAAFLEAGSSRPSATRTVTFKALGFDSQARRLVVDATADLAPLSETERQDALREAEAALRTQYGLDAIPEDRRGDEQQYQVLARALRETDDVRKPFSTATELRAALNVREASRLSQEYALFLEEEFPDVIDGETFEKLVEEAKKNSLPVLISSFGYDVVRRSMPGLLVLWRRSTPPT